MSKPRGTEMAVYRKIEFHKTLFEARESAFLMYRWGK